MSKAKLKFVYLLLGVSVPLTASLIWLRVDCARRTAKEHRDIDQLQEIAVEDSFPASDPPSTW